MNALSQFSLVTLLFLAVTGQAEPVWPYSCKQLAEMQSNPETICRLAEMGDAVELKRRLSERPALANTRCSINARYYGKHTVNNTLFTLVLAARDFWDFQDLTQHRQRQIPAECHPELFKYRVEEIEATGLMLSEIIDPNATHEVGRHKPPFAQRTNIETLCKSAASSGNQYIPHSEALDQMQDNLFKRGAVFSGYCGADKHPH